MAKIILMVGVPGSGKSTRANQLQSDDPTSIIVSRDKLREMIFGFSESQAKDYYKRPNIRDNENLITKVQDDIIRESLLDGKTVIVDNTNVVLRDINRFINFQVPIYFLLIDTPLEECIRRDKKRVRICGEDVIRKKYNDLQTLKKNFDFEPIIPKIEPIVCNPRLPRCFIFDIDGTLAIKGDRSPYDWDKVGLDTVNKNVYEILLCLEDSDYSSNVIICTGRDGICEAKTKEWLDKNHIWHDELHIRPIGNTEKDYIIKERMWRDIATRYNIIAIFDDRQQVVDHARRLGLTVCQVNYGNF